MEEQDNTVNIVLPLAIGIGVMAACGVIGMVLVLIATLVL